MWLAHTRTAWIKVQREVIGKLREWPPSPQRELDLGANDTPGSFAKHRKSCSAVTEIYLESNNQAKWIHSAKFCPFEHFLGNQLVEWFLEESPRNSRLQWVMPSLKARVCSSVTGCLPDVHGVLGLSPSIRNKQTNKNPNQSKNKVNSQRQTSALAFPSGCRLLFHNRLLINLVTSSPTNQATNAHTCSASFTFLHGNYQTIYYVHVSYISILFLF